MRRARPPRSEETETRHRTRMNETVKLSRRDRLVASAERLFRAPVEAVSTPGGEGRASYRLRVGGRSVIATLRPNFRRTHLEAFVLRRLAPFTDDAPRCLGVDGEILFQSDVGGRRLNVAVAEAPPETRTALAHEAVASIFRIHRAGRAAGLESALPHLGQNRDWLENLVDGRDALAEFSAGRAAGRDRDALCEALHRPGLQFVKWDCRSGNAAIGGDQRLRWFDFEYSGVRHGAEDLAWLIGDEAWPLAPDTMLEIVTEAFDPNHPDTRDAYLAYLSLYVALHCVQRLKLIVKEARKRGWLSKKRVRKYDDAGVHPEFALQICKVGAFFADRAALTRPLARDLEETGAVFAGILAEGEARAAAPRPA